MSDTQPLDLTDMGKYKAKKKWNGHDRYQCPRCPWDTLNKPAALRAHMVGHLKNNPAPAPEAAPEKKAGKGK